MLIVNKKAFSIGVFLAISFAGILLLIFTPIFGQDANGRGMTGLQFSDHMFNKLSKGSSNFIPALHAQNAAFMGKPMAVDILLDQPERVATAQKLLTAAGARVTANGTAMRIEGDLGAIMAHILRDAAHMYANDGAALAKTYGLDAMKVMETWWHVLKHTDKALKKALLVPEANLVHAVKNRAVETSYNFYAIPAEQVADEWPLVSGLLVFYVLYTMWWGFAIFYLFEGMGLTMKKAKVKKEV